MTKKSLYNINKMLILLTGYFYSTGDQTIQTLVNKPEQLVENQDAIKNDQTIQTLANKPEQLVENQDAIKNDQTTQTLGNKPEQLVENQDMMENETEIKYSFFQTLYITQLLQDMKQGKSVKFSITAFFLLFALNYGFLGLFYINFMEYLMVDKPNNPLERTIDFNKTKKEKKNRTYIILKIIFYNLILVFLQSRLVFFGNLYFYCIISIFISVFFLFFDKYNKMFSKKKQVMQEFEQKKSIFGLFKQLDFPQNKESLLSDPKQKQEEKEKLLEIIKKPLVSGMAQEEAEVISFIFSYIILVFLVFLSSYSFSFYELPFILHLKKNVFIFLFSFFFNFLYMFFSISLMFYLLKKLSTQQQFIISDFEPQFLKQLDRYCSLPLVNSASRTT